MNTANPPRHPDIVVGFLHVGSEIELPSLTVASVKKTMGCRVVQMTDMRSSPVEGADEVIRKPWTGKHLMPYRLLHLKDFPECNAIFLDTDILVQRDLSPVFDQEFDIALTRSTRNTLYQGEEAIPGLIYTGVNLTEVMPYNAGVMFSKPQGRDFWEQAYKHCLSLPAAAKDWWDDQLAIKKIADSGQFRLLELPCELYNYTPDSPEEAMTDKFVIHYKSRARKEWMLQTAL